MKLTLDQLAALVGATLARFRAIVREKSDTNEMNILAQAFGMLAFFGVGVPSSDEFLNNFWTTIGPVIYSARGTGALAPHARVVFHEVTHVVQFWRDPIVFVTRYCTAKGRAELEAEAERGAIEGWWILTGELPATRDDIDCTRHGYALDDAHADLTRDLLETACTSVSMGVLSTDVGLFVYGWMREKAPAAIVGHVIGGVP